MGACQSKQQGKKVKKQNHPSYSYRDGDNDYLSCIAPIIIPEACKSSGPRSTGTITSSSRRLLKILSDRSIGGGDHPRNSHPYARRIDDDNNNNHDNNAACPPSPHSSPELLPHEKSLQLHEYARDRRRPSICADPIDLSKPIQLPHNPKHPTEEKLICSTLKGNFFFDALSSGDRSALIGALTEHCVLSGSCIIRQGDVGDYFYILRDGVVSFHVDNVQVGPYRSKGCFGELALLYDAPRTATCIAESDCVLWRVDQLTFRYVIAKSKQNQQNFSREALKKVSYFKEVDEGIISKMIDSLTIVNFTKGMKIASKNSFGQAFYIIQEGQVKMHDVGLGESQYIDQVLDVGDHFGERSLMTNNPHHANFTAVTDCSLLCLTKSDFERTLGSLKDLLSIQMRKRLMMSVPIFAKSNFSGEEMSQLAELLVQNKYVEGDVLIKRGDVCEDPIIFYIEEGSISVVRDNGIVIKLQKGDHFGGELMKEPAGTISKVGVTVRSSDATLLELTKSSIESIIGTIDRLGKPQHFAAKTNMSLAPSDITKLKVIGEGAFGQIWLIQNSKDGKLYALKQLSKEAMNTEYIVKAVIRERNIMSSFNHPFIIKLLTTYRDKDYVYMVMNYLPGGSLFSLIHSSKRHCLPEDDAKFYAATILEALTYMHRLSICYRDLKPENVLIDDDGYCVLVDMGFAKDVVDKTYTFCGTTEYLAPEIVLSSGHNRDVDYWAFGCIIYEMLLGRSPFWIKGACQTTLMKRIVEHQPRFPDSIDDDARAIVEGLLEKKPMMRLGCTKGGANTIRQKKWFRSIQFDELKRKKIKAPWIPEVDDFEAY